MVSQAKRGKDGKKDFSTVQEFYIATFSSPVSTYYLVTFIIIVLQDIIIIIFGITSVEKSNLFHVLDKISRHLYVPRLKKTQDKMVLISMIQR